MRNAWSLERRLLVGSSFIFSGLIQFFFKYLMLKILFQLEWFFFLFIDSALLTLSYIDEQLLR